MRALIREAIDFQLSVTDRVLPSTIHINRKIYNVQVNPGSDWNIISPDNFNILSDNLVMKMTNKINLVLWF